MRDPSVSAGRGVALEALGRHREADASFADCFARADGLPASTRARLAWAYGFAISGRDADKARAAFDESLRHDPHNFQALYGRAMLAMSQGKNSEAIRGFEQALAVDPGRIEARRYRAIVLARQGQWERATQEVNWCLEQEPRSAATLYAAACVVARAFDNSGTSSSQARRSICSSVPWSRARIRRKPTKIPTSPRSVVSPGFSIWSARPGAVAATNQNRELMCPHRRARSMAKSTSSRQWKKPSQKLCPCPLASISVTESAAPAARYRATNAAEFSLSGTTLSSSPWMKNAGTRCFASTPTRSIGLNSASRALSCSAASP